MALILYGYFRQVERLEVETIGWVLSGLLNVREASDDDSEQSVSVVVNHVARDQSIDKDIQKLWDLETLDMTEDNEIHDEFVDNKNFNMKVDTV